MISDKVKLIVTLNKGQYENLKNIQCGSIGSRMIVNAVINGIPLDKNKGEWIFTDGQHVCSKCNLYNGIESDFCPNCGADMRGSK